MVRVENVVKRFGNQVVLDHVSVDFTRDRSMESLVEMALEKLSS